MKPHGTNAAHKRHGKAGEVPCGPCREARNAYCREWYRLNRQTGTSSSYLITDWLETHVEQSMLELTDGISAKSVETLRREVARMVKDGRVEMLVGSDAFGLLPQGDRWTYRLPE